MAGEKPTFGDDSHTKTVEQITFLLAGLIVLGAIGTAFLNYFASLGLGSSADWARIVDYFLQHIWPLWKVIVTIVSILAVIGIIYNSRKLRAISLEEKEIYDPTSGTIATDEEGMMAGPKNKKWDKVMEYVNSSNTSDWRLAIIEADVMLEELLRTLGYEGESLGEILKSVSKDEFLTIEDAWEAHKMRNTIAHSGGDFQLNERETRRVVALFENVFKEFGVI